jgi:hypothetical protein
MADPIPLNKAARQARRGGGRMPPPANEDEEIGCPVTALGHADGFFYFLNVVGERRKLSARQLGSRGDLATGLFLGDTAWLLRRFKAVDKDGNPAGFSVHRASEFLADACRRNGIYGDHVVIRRPGVWPGERGLAIAHCGDALFFDGEKHPAGGKFAGQIFAAAAREIYPAARPAGVIVARQIQADIQSLWRFPVNDQGDTVPGDLIAIGLVGQAYLAAALSWRANGFISGASNAGKSHLLDLLHAMVPLSHYTTDTTKAGIEGAVNGRAVPSFIDEIAEREDGQGGKLLIDVVLSSSSGVGTKGHRGTADGGWRSIEMVGSVIMASITPPTMAPQHRSRFTLIELIKPEAGADHRAAMQAAIARAKAEAPALFARALAGFERYKTALQRFRGALAVAGCVAREMDQMGSILAGQWILTEDGEPDDVTAAGVVRMVRDYIRGADEMATDDSSHIVLNRILSKVVNLERSTDQETIARLIKNAMLPDYDATTVRETAAKVLERWGIRVIRAEDLEDKQRRPIPRLGPGNGIWVDARVQPLHDIFNNTPYAGDRWISEIRRLPRARKAKFSVSVCSLGATKAIWISWDDINDVEHVE